MLFSPTLFITIIKDSFIILVSITHIDLAVVVTCHRKVKPLYFTFKDLIPFVKIGCFVNFTTVVINTAVSYRKVSSLFLIYHYFTIITIKVTQVAIIQEVIVNYFILRLLLQNNCHLEQMQ